MKEYVEKKVIIDHLERAIFGADRKIEKWVNQMPAADVRENVPSAWIDCDVNESGLENTVSLLCENCGNYTEFALVGTPKEVMDTMRFCPHCGAIMDGGDEP